MQPNYFSGSWYSVCLFSSRRRNRRFADFDHQLCRPSKRQKLPLSYVTRHMSLNVRECSVRYNILMNESVATLPVSAPSLPLIIKQLLIDHHTHNIPTDIRQELPAMKGATECYIQVSAVRNGTDVELVLWREKIAVVIIVRKVFAKRYG